LDVVIYTKLLPGWNALRYTTSLLGYHLFVSYHESLMDAAPTKNEMGQVNITIPTQNSDRWPIYHTLWHTYDTIGKRLLSIHEKNNWYFSDLHASFLASTDI
jgi:hypothetical protein